MLQSRSFKSGCIKAGVRSVCVSVIMAVLAQPVFGDVANWSDYSFLGEVTSIKSSTTGWQNITYSGSQIGTTEFLIVSFSHGNPPADQMVHIYKHKTQGGGWVKAVTAGNDDKSAEIWMREVTSANVNDRGQIEAAGAGSVHAGVLAYRGKAKVTATTAVRQTSTKTIAINNNGTAPYLIVAASDNNTPESDLAKVHFSPGDDRVFIYLTNTKDFKDTTTGALRGAIASLALADDSVALVNNAAFVSQVVPSSMVAGKTTNVTVRMKNTGTTSWTIAEGYKLGSQNVQDNSTWGFNRVNLPSGTTVAPGQEYSFSFSITAPTTAGTYNFQWKMVDDVTPNQGWFGAQSVNQAITVTASTTTVPWVTNLTEAAAGTAITNAGLKVGSISRAYHVSVGAGKVFSQTPGGNTSAARGSSVALAVSLGPVPNLVKNGSFETDAASWTLSGSAVRSTTSAAGGGVASLRINSASSSATQQVAIVSGKTYDISVSVNVATRTGGMVVFDTGDKYDAAGQGQFTFSATNGGWKVYSGSFTATNNFLTVRMFSDSAFVGTAYFDLIQLTPRP
ncbi:MAG: PASTA domain-containing protein [Kiritimatiellaceae bacterium]|nr:PASTA domain-containing protein [Kiritimatiellaceae bacterium]